MFTPTNPTVDAAPYRGSQSTPSRETDTRAIELSISENSKQPLRIEQVPQTRDAVPTLESTEKTTFTGSGPGDLIYALGATPSTDAMETIINPVGIR